MGGFNKDDNQDGTVDLSTCFFGGWIWRHAKPFPWPLIHHSLGSYVSSWKIIYSIDEKALMKRHWFWCKYKSNFCPLVYKWSGYSIFRNISLALKGAYARAICRQFKLRVFPHSYSHRQRISNDPDSGLIPERVSPQSRARSRCLFRRAVSQSLAFYRPTMPHSNVKILVHFRFSHQLRALVMCVQAFLVAVQCLHKSVLGAARRKRDLIYENMVTSDRWDLEIFNQRMPR